MYNKISLMGRLTHVPELKVTQNGIPFCDYGDEPSADDDYLF